MEQLQNTLESVLGQNAEETDRWKKYLEEHQTTIQNIETFNKKLEVEVMVPVGNKAMMPGHIYHTNEIFISHYRGLFSNCSAHQAIEVCNYRIKMAKERLESLGKELNMFQDNLSIPFSEGAFPHSEGREIIEEYNEEKEQIWREEHKRKVREYKQKQAKEQMKPEMLSSSDDDVLKLLDDLEMMEELDEELESLQINDEEMYKQLMASDIKLPEKKRLSHYLEKSDTIVENTSKIKNNEIEKTSSINSIIEKYQNHNMGSSEILFQTLATDNNYIASDVYKGDSDDSSNEDIPDEIIELEKQTSHLSSKQKIQVFKKRIKNINIELKLMEINSVDSLNNKMNKIGIRDYIMDYVEMLKYEIQNENMNESNETKTNLSTQLPTGNKKKKQISFALEDEVQIIDNKRAPNTVLKSKNYQSRDIIQLNAEYKGFATNKKIEEIDMREENRIVDKKKAILDKVEKNLQFVSENQSQQDCDVVGRILNQISLANRTLHIDFEHSNKIFKYPGYKIENNDNLESDFVGSPADIYRVFKTYFSIDKRNDIHLIDTSDNKMNSNSTFVDPKLELANNIKKETEEFKLLDGIKDTRSILKNKDKVVEEKHLMQEVSSPETSKPIETVSTFEMIVGNVIENKSSDIIDEPLPKKFIDTHAPKKRISRFKQMRNSQADK